MFTARMLDCKNKEWNASFSLLSFEAGNCLFCRCVYKPMKTQCMKSFLTGLGIMMICAGYVACTSEQAPKPGTTVSCENTVVTSARIYAIVQQNCTNRSCHPGG